MMEVRLKRNAFIGGRRFKGPIAEIPDEFADHLPKDAEILSRSKEESSETPPADTKPKTYTGCRKVFEDKDSGASVAREDVVKFALNTFSEAGLTVEDWNELSDKERRKRIDGAAREILATL